MSGSCHLDRALNVEVGFEWQIFIIFIFFNCGWILQFGAHSRYYRGALTQKISVLGVCNTFRSDFHVGWKNKNKYSTLNSSFNTLSKWHEPDIRPNSCRSKAKLLQEAMFLIIIFTYLSGKWQWSDQKASPLS